MKSKKHARRFQRPRTGSAALDWKTKHELAATINAVLRQDELSQPAAAAVLRMPQPKISALVNYRLDGFSVQRLIRILNGLGKDVVIQVGDKQAPGRLGRTSVSAA
ncbi:MAG: helix-turn-helix domain-containing protein [Acidobacteriia bacterium]|nr:helix-turn-helix domain-containing protein [Terriglobia bacterium]